MKNTDTENLVSWKGSTEKWETILKWETIHSVHLIIILIFIPSETKSQPVVSMQILSKNVKLCIFIMQNRWKN